jgi:hypothetical protein
MSEFTEGQYTVLYASRNAEQHFLRFAELRVDVHFI